MNCFFSDLFSHKTLIKFILWSLFYPIGTYYCFDYKTKLSTVIIVIHRSHIILNCKKIILIILLQQKNCGNSLNHVAPG